MYLKTKSGRLVILPTPEEDAAINAGIAADPDTFELTEEWFAKAKRMSGRPKAVKPKQQVSIRFSHDVVEYFRKTGKGWQTRMDAALREWIASR
jgi:uncharacterized protein (DUF4415 family)